jgi:nucleoside-diphosphate-sugar epimerase
MKLLVTGATGFLGSHLTRFLLSKGYEIIIVKRSFSNTSRIDSILSSVVSYDMDKVALESIFNEHKIDIVIHTATNYGKLNSNFSDVIEANVVFPLRLLELLAVKGKAFINTDTFFNNDKSHLYSYLSSYSISKKYFCELAEKYIENTQISLINARLEHLYGPHDDKMKFTMQIISKLLRNVPNIELTRGNQERDFIYVDDAVSAYYHIIQNISLFNQKVTNLQVGNGTVYSIREFVELSKKITKSTSELLFGVIPQRQNEIFHSQADNRKLKALGWSNNVDLESGIKNIVKQLNDKKEAEE